MSVTDLNEANLEQELAKIPPEYQEMFRNVIAQELRESGQNTTDQAILRYLRQRLADFDNGAFIRPDGRPGMVTLSPDGKYETALEQLNKDYAEVDPEAAAERKRTMLKLAGFAVLAVLLLVFVMGGRGRSDEEVLAAENGTPALHQGGDEAASTPTLEPLPAISEDSLSAIGSSGGSLALGRPSLLELHYSATEETIALAIDPSQTTPRGELRFQESVMLSDNPVAVWLAGTRLNYGLGLPDNMIRALQPGDRVVINTDTGAIIPFVVTEVTTLQNFATNQMFNQNRIGMTLFALPAVSEDSVSVAYANYDVSREAVPSITPRETGDPFSIGPVEVAVRDIAYSHELNGRVSIDLTGEITGDSQGSTVMVSLVSNVDQTESIELPLPGSGPSSWGVSFTMSSEVEGLNLLAEFRAFPSGEVSLVHLGDVPHLANQLQVTTTGDVYWRLDRGEAVMPLSIHNPGAGSVRLGPDYIKATQMAEGGVENSIYVTVIPGFPLMVGPGETVVVDVTFVPALYGQPVHIQIGFERWEVSGFPTANTP